jgi:retron-type reverse transcriptase
LKSFNNLYEQIYNFDNLHLAYLKARKNKRYKKEVLEFSSNLEERLIGLQNELIWQTYKPGRYREFYVHDPKTRLILSLPFRDRVIHQALYNVVEPIFESTFISDSFACRKNKGTLAGVKRNEKFLLKELNKNKEVFCLKMDIRKYFYNIDHEVLKNLIRKKIRCKRTLGLIDVIIDSTENPGIPVGNLTSQLFANIYLNEVDHFIKEKLRAKYFVRYMDDMIILHNDKYQLWKWLSEIRGFLKTLRLELNEKTSVFNSRKGIDFLGYRQFSNYRILRKRIIKKNYRKFNKFIKSEASIVQINNSLQSLFGQCKHCNSKQVLSNVENILGEKLWAQIFLS